MNKKQVGITFQATFSKATTTVDGGWNITFSAPQSEAKNVMQLSELRDYLLQLAVVPSSAGIGTYENEESPR